MGSQTHKTHQTHQTHQNPYPYPRVLVGMGKGCLERPMGYPLQSLGGAGVDYKWKWEGVWDLGLLVLGLVQMKVKSGVTIQI